MQRLPQTHLRQRRRQSLEDAVRALATTDQEGLPVLDSDSENAIGWLTHQRILRAYHARLDNSD
jgi:predicted transcriptional regulator